MWNFHKNWKTDLNSNPATNCVCSSRCLHGICCKWQRCHPCRAPDDYAISPPVVFCETELSTAFYGHMWRCRNCVECRIHSHAQSATSFLTSCRLSRHPHAVAYLWSVQSNATARLSSLKLLGGHWKIFISERDQQDAPLSSLCLAANTMWSVQSHHVSS